MSYDLYIWDPTRHAPLPSTDAEPCDTKERLSELADGRNTWQRLGSELLDALSRGNPSR